MRPTAPLTLALEDVVETPPAEDAELVPIGTSREGRPISGRRFGHGALRISLIAGCHADEPVGPEMLRRLAGWLASRPAGDPVLTAATWSVVPHVNPDGARRNASWSTVTVAAPSPRGKPDRGFDLLRYLRGAVREAPGDDVEFGFPRGDEDAGARPENRAVAGFLAEGAPFHLHMSLHGMAFSPGPWFLMEESWIERTAPARRRLRRRVRDMGYELFDVDRRGEKGFHRIDEGFTTRPDSRAMAAHFEALGDPETAARFRPSSMEYVRSLGGGPLTLVSEMPLFLISERGPAPAVGADDAERRRFRAWLAELAALPEEEARAAARRAGIRPMPIGDQMRLQLAFLEEGLAAAAASFL